MKTTMTPCCPKREYSNDSRADEPRPDEPRPRVVCVMGPPGAGKGTIAGRLSARFGCPVVAPGVIYRRIMAENNELSDLVRESLKDGGYCPNSLTNKIVGEEVVRVTPGGGASILDGYPRTQEQLDYIPSNFDVIGYLHIDADFERLSEACASRRSCKSCGVTFSAKRRLLSKALPVACRKIANDMDFVRNKMGAVCAYFGDDGGESWTTRWDDGAEFYAKRYESYGRESRPLLEQINDSPLYGRFDLLTEVGVGSEVDANAVVSWFSKTTGLPDCHACPPR